MTSGALVPFPNGEADHPPAGSASRLPGRPCPVCGQAATSGHPVPPQVHVDRIGEPRLPDGLSVVLARTGEVSRRAREQRAAEQQRTTALAEYLVAQVGVFLEASARAGVQPRSAVRAGDGRRVGRGPTVACFPVRHWRSHVSVVGDVPRTRHLFVAADGSLLETPVDPGVSAATDETPAATRVDLAALFHSMGELDARQAVERVIAGLADLMKESGVTL